MTASKAGEVLVRSANHDYYDSPGVAEYFGSYKSDLFKAEEFIFDSLKEQLADHPILEIGIGGGRITRHLALLTKDYIGVDSSDTMVEFCRRRFSDLTLLVCDARNMSCFKSEQFNAVIFGYNGIDEVGPYDRALILKEINRILKTNGTFIFSSHNLDWAGIPACFLEGCFSWGGMSKLTNNLLCFWIYTYGLWTHMLTRARRKGDAVFLEYESSPGVALPVYYVNKEAQIRKLRESGFTDVSAISFDGTLLNNENRRKHFMVFYVARKNESAH